MLLLHVENTKSPYRGRGDTTLPPLGRSYVCAVAFHIRKISCPAGLWPWHLCAWRMRLELGYFAHSLISGLNDGTATWILAKVTCSGEPHGPLTATVDDLTHLHILINCSRNISLKITKFNISYLPYFLSDFHQFFHSSVRKFLIKLT